MNAAGIGDSPHQAVERIDFPYQMAFSEPANRRIAGHGADSRESMGDKGRFCPQTRRCGRGFTAGMAAADHDDIEFRDFGHWRGFYLSRGKG